MSKTTGQGPWCKCTGQQQSMILLSFFISVFFSKPIDGFEIDVMHDHFGIICFDQWYILVACAVHTCKAEDYVMFPTPLITLIHILQIGSFFLPSISSYVSITSYHAQLKGRNGTSFPSSQAHLIRHVLYLLIN